MKVLFDARRITSQHTGLGQVALQLLDNIIQLDQRNYYYITTRDLSILPPSNRYEIVSLPRMGLNYRGGRQLSQFWSDQNIIPNLLSRYNIEVLVSPYYEIPLSWHGRIVATIYDLSVLGIHREYWVDPYYAALLKATIKRAELVFTTSQYSSNKILEKVNNPNLKVRLIYPIANPIFYQLDNIQRVDLSNKYHSDNGYILYSGGIGGGRKNLIRTVKAFARYYRRAKNPLPLVMAGANNRMCRTIQREAVKEGVGNALYFTGFVSPLEVVQLYRSARLVIYTSLMEGFGFPILEAMLCGVPVVCSNNSCLPEISDGSAFLVDPYDITSISEGMLGVAEDEPLRELMILKGQKRALYFTAAKMRAQVSSALKEIGFIP